MPHQRLDQRAPRIPDLDTLVPTPRRQELAAAARGRCLLQPGHAGQVHVRGRGSKGTTLDHMFVAQERRLHFPAPCIPQPRHLIIPRRQQPAAVEARAHGADPIAMAPQCFHAVPRRDIPDPQAFIPTRAHQQIAARRRPRRAAGHEPHRGNTVIVPGQRADVLVLLAGIPQLYGEIVAAARQQHPSAGAAVVAVQHAVRVALDRAFQFSEFPVPDLEGAVFGGGGEGGKSGVEG